MATSGGSTAGAEAKVATTNSMRWWAWSLRALVLVVVFGAGVGVGWLWRSHGVATTTLAPNTVKYRYRFGGEVITQYLPNVMAVTVYRTAKSVDEVVFNQQDGHDYVLNADKLVDYQLPSDGSVEQREILDKLYYHYDPMLQGEKQQLHEDWTDQEFSTWVGRLPTDAEWTEVFSELTRGVDHRQMDRWIQYSPPACTRLVNNCFETLAGRKPTQAELDQYYRRLIDGASYGEVESAIAKAVGRK